MDPNGLDINYMPFPMASHMHQLHMSQHNMPMLQAVTHMHHPQQGGMGLMQPHSASLDFLVHQGPVDPAQHMQQPMQHHTDLSAEVPRRRNRKRDELDPTKPKKRQRSKKPVDAPTRPKSAYMFFLGEFRERYKLENPDSKKVAEVASAAGEKWRSLSEEEKKGYEEASEKAKADYKVVMAEYEREHPKPPRRQKRARDPTELKRPQSAYFFFLADFRELYKRDHPDEAVAVKIIGKEAGERWKNMSAQEKEPYDTLSTASKQEYARMKQLTPAERIMLLAAQAMNHTDQNLIVPSYMDTAGHMAHAGQSMTAALDGHMGMDSNLDPSMDPSMGTGLQPDDEEDQFGTGMQQEEEEEGSDDGARALRDSQGVQGTAEQIPSDSRAVRLPDGGSQETGNLADMAASDMPRATASQSPGPGRAGLSSPTTNGALPDALPARSPHQGQQHGLREEQQDTAGAQPVNIAHGRQPQSLPSSSQAEPSVPQDSAQPGSRPTQHAQHPHHAMQAQHMPNLSPLHSPFQQHAVQQQDQQPQQALSPPQQHQQRQQQMQHPQPRGQQHRQEDQTQQQQQEPRDEQQQMQQQFMLPRTGQYHQQVPDNVLRFQQYRADSLQQQHQQQHMRHRMNPAIHQYPQHPESLMHFQHQASLEAAQQHQQMQNMPPILVNGMRSQMQGRAGPFYPSQGLSEVQPSQASMGMPLNYPQWSNQQGY